MGWDYIVKNNLSRPLVLTDANVAQLDFFKYIVDALKEKNFSQVFPAFTKTGEVSCVQRH
jgi:alcohol dehydrogenase class IV